jgi:hypothetical protein
MLKSISILFGVIMLVVGVLGFVPGAAPNGHLLGMFHVNAFHNMVHVLSGLAALIAGITSTHAARLFFRIFGVIYGLVAVLGFFYGPEPIFGILANNMADTWLHVAIAAVSLLLGFAVRETPAPALRETPA